MLEDDDGPTWDEIIVAIMDAWPDTNPVWSETPLELITKLIDERDELRRAVEACRRYFEHCQRVSLSARHAGCDSPEMDVRQSLKREAMESVHRAVSAR